MKSSYRNVILSIIVFGGAFSIFLYYSYLHEITAINQSTASRHYAPRQHKTIALTFDDGPYGPSTSEVLNILQREHVKATFFLIGKNTAEYPQEARDEVADGNTIANHSYDHSKFLATMTPAEFEKNIKHADEIIYKETSLHPRIFRAPYGSTSDTMIKALQDKGYALVEWSIDPKDWDDANVTSQMIVSTVTSQAKSGSIVLMHDGRDTQIDYSRDNMLVALPQVIRHLKNAGYAFVTIDQMINQKPYFN
jgi:peptidoglycan/xylan/chitin deacetylase (PgdA/CDA1 family)